jgi:uncharacterized protein DUF3551
MKPAMRSILLAAALIGAASTFPDTGAMAQSEPWCSAGREDGGENCRFNSYEQCRATGPDGWCVRNSHGATAAQAPATAQMVVPADTPAPVETRPVRRRPDTRQSIVRPPPALARPATNSPARPATNIVPPRAVANVSIPLPDRALLAPPPDFNCEFTGAISPEANAARQPTLASAPANPDAARMKADYERQCYRHVELISRDRLQRLQASIGATVKAVRSEPGGAKTPLPAPALLAATPEFNCEYKAGGDPPAPGPAADAALQTKLDYELQCYRHASIIWRDRIQQLQASIGETAKALNRNKQTAAEPRRSSHN